MTEKIGLYHPDILHLNQFPKGFEKRENAQVILKASNPVCGDRFQLYLDFEEGVLINAAFHGYGCAVSKASTSILTEMIKGKEVKDILIKINAFITALKGDQLDSTNLNDQLRIFSGVKEYPARKKCVSLPWEELRDYLVKSSYI